MSLLAALLAGALLLAPVAAITAEVERLAAGRDSGNLLIRGRDELSALAQKFNELSQRVRSDRVQWEDERGRFINIFRSIDDAVLLLDAGGLIRFSNDDAQGRLGTSGRRPGAGQGAGGAYRREPSAGPGDAHGEGGGHGTARRGDRGRARQGQIAPAGFDLSAGPRSRARRAARDRARSRSGPAARKRGRQLRAPGAPGRAVLRRGPSDSQSAQRDHARARTAEPGRAGFQAGRRSRARGARGNEPHRSGDRSADAFHAARSVENRAGCCQRSFKRGRTVGERAADRSQMRISIRRPHS